MGDTPVQSNIRSIDIGDPSFDLNRLRLPVGSVPQHTEAPVRKRSGKFIRGPIDWEWITRAARLPGKALGMGLILWQKAGYTPGKYEVKVTLQRGEELGIREGAARRAIRSLATAGLIRRSQRNGQASDITIVTPLDRPQTQMPPAVSSETKSAEGKDLTAVGA